MRPSEKFEQLWTDYNKQSVKASTKKGLAFHFFCEGANWEYENIAPKRSKDYAYKKGFDSSVNGANTKNCHGSIFSSPENTRAWEEGVKDGTTHNHAVPHDRQTSGGV